MGTGISETGMELRDLLLDPGFPKRRKSEADPNRESVALRRLARTFAGNPEFVLQELVDIAVEFCGADSAGISLEEESEAGDARFRWVVVAGSFQPYLNGTTPRQYSPCGTCLNSGKPQLYRVTKPYYDYLGVLAEPITDGILIPWSSDDSRGTLWAVAHHSDEAFDLDDYRLLKSLADFAAIAIRHQHQQEVLRREEREAASAARAHELAHQINNPLQSLTNTLYLARQGGDDTSAYIEQAARDLSSLSELVKRVLSLTNPKAKG
jgi:hypothetical protein